MAQKGESKTPATRYVDPFAAFRSEMDRMFGDFFADRALPTTRALAPTGGPGFVVPSMDVKENDKAIVVTAELPGLAEDDVELVLRDGVLTLKGEKKYEHEDDKDDVHLIERRYGSFQRALRVPGTVDPAGIDARFDKGVLTVTMPKRADAADAARKIKVARA
jgi:HSP20 family protein